MKGVCTLILFLFLGYAAQAQQGFGANNPDKSSVIDLTATNKGALLPRVALTSTTDVTTIATPAHALTVFNTATAGDVTPGYYYYVLDAVTPANSKWVRLATGLDAWSTKGNSGTTAGTNFVGTLDARDLVLKTNNLERLRITQTGRLDLSNTSGSGTNIFVDGGNETVTGIWNTAIGRAALQNNVSGNNNTAFGAQALTGLTTGSDNVAIGERSLGSLIDGFSNTAIGKMAGLSITSGGSNLLVGMQAGPSLTTGNNNIFLGNSAGDLVTTGSNNIAIGISATLLPTTNNQLNIGNAIFGIGLTGTNTAPAGNIGIGTASPAARLDVSGTARVSNTTASTATKVLGSDANGQLNDVTIGAGLALSSGKLSVGASNGLNSTSGDVKLGGSLLSSTTIDQAANTLSFTGTATSLFKITNTSGTVATPVSALQIVDGSEASGKVLTSDASGNTSWTYSAIKAIPGTWGTTVANFTGYGTGTPRNTNLYTNHSITLPPGKWMVHFGDMASIGDNVAASSKNINTSDAQLWCTGYLTDGTTISTTTSDYIAAYGGQRGSGGSIGRGMNRTFVNGAIAINNTSTGNKTYYLWANQELETYSTSITQISINGTSTAGYWQAVFGLSWERYFYAIPIQ